MSNLTTYNNVKTMLYRQDTVARLSVSLPSNVTPEQFNNVALMALSTNPDIQSCTTESIMQSLIKCAQDGLMPDGREAALVKYNTKDKATGAWVNKAQYMPMVYGLIKRMRNSGDVTGVNAYIVYENDKFEFKIVNGIEQLIHEPVLIGDRGKPALAYCVVRLRDNDPHIEIMIADEIEKTRSKSKSKDSGPWVDWWDEMAKKTVIHRAAKRVPSTSDIMSVIRNDQSAMMAEDADEAETQNERRSTLISQINSAINAETGEIVDVEPTEQPQDKGVYLDA